MQIIPPGMEFHHIIPQDGDMDGEIEGSGADPSSPDPPIWAEVLTSLSSPSPLVCNRESGNMKIRYHCFQLGGYPFFAIDNKKRNTFFFFLSFGAIEILIPFFTFVIFIWQIMRFFTNPRKPMILALARADPKKNITTLVKAFGECRSLRELANLVWLNL